MTPAEMRDACEKIATQYAKDCGPSYGDGYPAVECLNIAKAIRAIPIPDEATKPDSDILTAAYLFGAYDWRKKAERMRAALEKALGALETAKPLMTGYVISSSQLMRGENEINDALAAIREALGET